MQFDVIIPTYNNFEVKNNSLHYTLRSILSQSVQPKKIIIVENFDFEKAKYQIEIEFGKLISVIDGTSVPKNISYARNLGVQHGDAELIIFMDDDVVIGNNNSFEQMIAKMKNLDFCCGAMRYWTRTNWIDYLNKSYSITHLRNILKYKTYLPKSIERLSGNPSFHEYSFIGHFGIIKRTVFQNVNGFDETYKEWAYQDTDLMMRLCIENFQYDLLCNDYIAVYHLSHKVDKTKFQDINKEIFLQKQKELGIKFHLNHFFGIFDDDKYSILS